jgi:hypothetical protein
MYRLDQLDRGAITLLSGIWRWFVIRVNSMPGEKCEVQYLIFANESISSDIMHARVPSDVDAIDVVAVKEFARHADDRSFRTPKGRYVLRPPANDGRIDMWQVRPDRGMPFRTNWYIEKAIGDLTASDLEEIVRGSP